MAYSNFVINTFSLVETMTTQKFSQVSMQAMSSSASQIVLYENRTSLIEIKNCLEVHLWTAFYTFTCL